MRKIVWVLSLFMFLMAGRAAAQTAFGVKAGVNIAKLNYGGEMIHNLGDRSFELEPFSRVAFSGGIFVKIRAKGNIYVQPEVLYSRQGWYMEGESGGTRVRLLGKMDYINVPVMFRFGIGRILSIDAGPQVGYMVNAKNVEKIKGGGRKREVRNVDMGNTYKRWDFDMAFGATVNLTSSIHLSGRYIIGLNKVVKGYSGSSNHHVAQFALGWRL